MDIHPINERAIRVLLHPKTAGWLNRLDIAFSALAQLCRDRRTQLKSNWRLRSLLSWPTIPPNRSLAILPCYARCRLFVLTTVADEEAALAF